MSAIQIVNAKKNFNDLWALKGINLNVEPGEFFGLLGPNGAGKTTLIRSLVGLSRLSEGQIVIHGFDCQNHYQKARQLIGFAPQEVNLDRFFSIHKILMYQAGFFGVPRKDRKDLVDGLLAQFQLTEKANLPYYRLSGGMQKRLLIAKGMVNQPRILILDEPTAGVDVEQRHHLWEYLKTLNRNGTTIILTTHYIDEAESLCDRIGIINLGEICETGSPTELITRYCEKKVTIQTSTPVKPELFHNEKFEVTLENNHLILKGDDIGVMTQRAYHLLNSQPEIKIEDIQVDKGNLEDVFLKLTGRCIGEDK